MVELYLTCPECGNHKFESEADDYNYKCVECGQITDPGGMQCKVVEVKNRD